MDLIWLIFAHYIGDWGLQSDWIAKNKGSLWMVMLAHCMIWTACMAICMEWLGILTLSKIIFLFWGHFTLDEMKCHLLSSEKWWPIYPDQFLHIVQCLIIWTK